MKESDGYKSQGSLLHRNMALTGRLCSLRENVQREKMERKTMAKAFYVVSKVNHESYALCFSGMGPPCCAVICNKF